MAEPERKIFPHDALVRREFGIPEHAAAQFRSTLPPTILEHLDLDTLRVEDSSFVSEELRGTVVDVLYSATYRNRPAFLYVLFEHMSTVDPLMPLRGLSGAIHVWERHVHNARARDTAILPLPFVLVQVLHHSASGWTAATRFEQLFDPAILGDPAVQTLIPHWGFLLDDISRVDDAHIHARHLDPVVTLTLVLLRDSRAGKALVHTIHAHQSEFEEVFRSPGGREAFLVFVLYVLTVTQGAAGREAIEALKAVPGARDVVMTYAEELRAEGKAEGKVEGMVAATRRMLLNLLTLKFQTVPPDVRTRVEAASESECMVWAERLLDATSVGDVFAD